MKVAAETKTDSEMMVVVESVVLGAMLVLHRRHGVQPQHCGEFIEMAVQQATERFAAQVKP